MSLNENLKQVLADSYALYIKTQNYHWNITGPNFRSLHLLFEEQYTDLAAAIDEIAERIRTLGDKAPGSFSKYASITNIKDGDENASANNMVKQLSEDQSKIISSLSAALEAAQEKNDEATIGLVVDRISIHEKNAWMLNSSI